MESLNENKNIKDLKISIVNSYKSSSILPNDTEKSKQTLKEEVKDCLRKRSLKYFEGHEISPLFEEKLTDSQ